ncbi:ABC transporter permease [Microvirga sp. 3-52]|uniref:ABC transporter permease n=1 Tax=Microvirga sp. 3-52 TaxID=2792425 RepID=UPI0020C0ED08|nr:ABC transporter permease [Microvirga sp. 3-52]
MTMTQTFEPPANAGAQAEGSELLAGTAAPQTPQTKSQSYASLVWRRFRHSIGGLVGGFLVTLILLIAVFANFLSPYDPGERSRTSIYLPPQGLHFFAADGFHLVPFTHPIEIELDPATYQPKPTENTAVRCTPAFMGKGWSYSFLGFSLERHLFAAPANCPFHILGTDREGRDMLSRLLVGSRLTLMMAIMVVLASVIIGTIIGITSGYLGGRADHYIQRVVEFFLALPELPFFFALVAIIPRNVDALTVFVMLAGILVFLHWAQLAREVRGKALSISQYDYVTAAIAVGARTPRIIFRHILPNVMSHVIVITTLMIPKIVLLESFLSFLGLGVQPPLVSWGLLLNSAKDLQTLGSYPWALVPVAAILVTVLSFNMLGDGLRDAMDPYHT